MSSDLRITDVASLRQALLVMATKRKTSLTALAALAKTGSGLANFAHNDRQKDVHVGPILAVLKEAGYELVLRPRPRPAKRQARMEVHTNRKAGSE